MAAAAKNPRLSKRAKKDDARTNQAMELVPEQADVRAEDVGDSLVVHQHSKEYRDTDNKVVWPSSAGGSTVFDVASGEGYTESTATLDTPTNDQTTSVNAAFAAVEPLAVEPVFNAVQHIRVVQPVPATNQPASGEQVVASTQRENTVVEPTPNVVQGEATPNPTDVPATTNEDQDAVTNENLVVLDQETGIAAHTPNEVASTQISTDTREYFEPELVQRLNVLNNYFKVASSCVTLHTFPFDRVTWGPIGTGQNDKSDFLMFNGQPIMVWTVAELLYPNFNRQGVSLRKPGVLFRPLLDEDFNVALRILNTMSCPVKEAAMPDGVWASRWMGNQTMSPDDVPQFTRVYDALAMFKPKAQMDKYSVSDLEKGDIVLVEMYVTRWAIKDEKDRAETSKAKRFEKNRSWKKWNVDFRLDAISVLYPGSEYAAGGSRADEAFEA